jgi:hypothetical protein
VVTHAGRSLTRPPRMSTSECSCRLWPTPGMYVVTSMPLVRRTRATLRSAEFGFLGVWVKTRTHTPLLRAALERRALRLRQNLLAPESDQLANRRHRQPKQNCVGRKASNINAQCAPPQRLFRFEPRNPTWVRYSKHFPYC